MIRRPAAAGTFYPEDPSALAHEVDDLLSVTEPSAFSTTPRAIVAPHAGYAYAGPVAASAYALVGGAVRRVALLGPAHFVPLRGSCVPSAQAWATPLGDVALDPELLHTAAKAGAAIDDRPHEFEHALEVQLPFLLRILDPGFGILPIAVGVDTPERVADLIDRIWDRADLVVVSTDLSHDLDEASADRRDRRTADAVLARDPGAIGDDAACGAFALRGLAELARRRDLRVDLLDLRTSADTMGHPERVVGYGAFSAG